MRCFLLCLFILPVSLLSWAQETEEMPGCNCNSVNDLIEQVFRSALMEARSFLSAGSDPYGIQIALTVRTQEAGQAAVPYTAFNSLVLTRLAQELADEQKFDTYHFDAPGSAKMIGESWQYNVGITPQGLIKNDTREFQLVAKNYSCNRSENGVVSKVIIQVYVTVTGKKPVDGAIQTDVFAYDRDGARQQWRVSWGTGGHIAYVRIGPGNDSGNSGQGKDNWKQVSAQVTMDPNYNPGYYLPKIKHRGCIQDFSLDPEKFKSLEVYLKLDKIPDWNDFVVGQGGNVIPKNTLETETKKAPDFQTWFSLGNTVTGTVFDPQGNPVKKGVKVHIQPSGWNWEKQVEPVETNDQGIYKFDRNIETGVYKVFTEDNPGGAEIIEVCNCPEKNEEPNHLYDNVDINDQTDLTFLLECNESYTENIEPLQLEGKTLPPGKVTHQTKGYSVIRIQSKVINDFFEETYINNVIGAPADDKNKVVSFSSEKYSFDPADTEGDGVEKSVAATADYTEDEASVFIFPAQKIDGRMQDSDLFQVDSIAPNSKLEKKLQEKKWELFFGPGMIEGRGLDKEIITKREARPVSLRELKQCKEYKSSIRLEQELEYRQGYNTNFVGLGKFMDEKDREGLEVFSKLMEDPGLLNEAMGGVENMEKVNPEMAKYMKANKGQANMAVFMRSSFGLDKYSGMFESLASKVKIKREITIRPISDTEADKYLTSGKAFEVTGNTNEPDVDPDQLKDVLKNLFKSE